MTARRRVAITGIGLVNSAAIFVPMAPALVLGSLFAITAGISKMGRSTRRAAVPWLCGYASEAESNRYVAHNFYGEIKRYFGWLGGAAHVPGSSVVRRLK